MRFIFLTVLTLNVLLLADCAPGLIILLFFSQRRQKVNGESKIVIGFGGLFFSADLIDHFQNLSTSNCRLGNDHPPKQGREQIFCTSKIPIFFKKKLPQPTNILHDLPPNQGGEQGNGRDGKTRLRRLLK